MLPVLAIVMVAMLTFLYTVATAVRSKTEVIELKIEMQRLRDNYAKRRDAANAGELMDLSDMDGEIEVIDSGLGGAGPANQAA